MTSREQSWTLNTGGSLMIGVYIFSFFHKKGFSLSWCWPVEQKLLYHSENKLLLLNSTAGQTIKKNGGRAPPSPQVEVELQLFLLLLLCAFSQMRTPASIHSSQLRGDTRGEYWSFFLIRSHSLPARSRWGRNLIRGKYHQTWWTWWLPRLPPVVCCPGSSRPDRCKLILCSATPILLCHCGREASWGKFTAHIRSAGDYTARLSRVAVGKSQWKTSHLHQTCCAFSLNT